MSKRRIDKLEGSLSPKEAVLHWLVEAHAFGSLPAYAESLIEQPDTAQPFIALPARVSKAIYGSMRRERTAAIKTATKEAMADATFLLKMVIDLNVHIEATLRLEGLRHAALLWWSRALDATSEAKQGTEPGSRADWQRGVATLRGALLGNERGRAVVVERYLDGHAVLFPELAAGWRDLCAAAGSLGDGVAADDIAAAAEQDVQRIVRMARAEGLQAGGRIRAADQIASRVLARPGTA